MTDYDKQFKSDLSFSGNLSNDASRVIDGVRLAVISVLLSVGLGVGLGIGFGVGGCAGAIVGPVSGVGPPLLLIASFRWRRSRKWLAEAADWAVGRWPPDDGERGS